MHALRHLDLTLPTPAENLACDEALLDWCDGGASAEGILRLWEAREPFIVLGYANHAAAAADLDACRAHGIPVLRRCSGGGAVLQATLVDLIDLSLIAKQAHWNVVGPNFRSAHLQLDELVTAARQYVDDVAERANAIGISPNGKVKTVQESSGIPEYPDNWQSVESTVAAIASEASCTVPRWPTIAVSTSTYSGSAASAPSAGRARAKTSRSRARDTPHMLPGPESSRRPDGDGRHPCRPRR